MGQSMEPSNNNWTPSLFYILEDEGFTEEEIYRLAESYESKKTGTIINVDFTEKDISEDSELEPEIEKLKLERQKVENEKKRLDKEIKELEMKKRKKGNKLFELIGRFISREEER